MHKAIQVISRALAALTIVSQYVSCGYSFSFKPQNCLVGDWQQKKAESDNWELYLILNSDMTYELLDADVSEDAPISEGTYTVEYSMFTILKNSGEIRFIQNKTEDSQNPGDHYVKFTWTGSQEKGPESLKMVEDGRYKMLVWVEGDAQ